MVLDWMPSDSGAQAELADYCSVFIEAFRLFAADDRDVVPAFGKTYEVWQDLRTPQRVRQAVVGNVEDPCTLQLASLLVHATRPLLPECR